jgi:acetyl-CoA carboxylase biotin carboxyl carrier protein
MDHRELKKLVQLMNDNELVELEIEQEGMRVSLRKAVPPVGPVIPVSAPALAAAAAPLAAAVPSGAPAEEEAPPGTELIRSPMVGTFYRRPSPDADPYVDVGATVDEESVICIVEAMKVNNELKAELRGQIVEVLVEDGEPVEFDQPLFRLKVA